MKNFKVFTVAMLMAGAAVSFTSCGGGDSDSETSEKENNETITKIENGFDGVKQLINAVEGGDIKVDKSNSEDIHKFFSTDDEDDEYMNADKNFDGYSFNRSYSMLDGVLNSASYSTFYDDDKKDEAKKDSEEILAFLEDKLGKADGGDSFNDWETDDYTLSFNIFDDGYSMYLNSHIEEDYEPLDTDYSDDENCVGDFYGLKNDLKDLFVTNISNGSIKIGSTTKSEMATITGDEDGFDKEYDGLRVSGYFSYEGDKLSSISLDYFYDCEGAMSLLDMDKGDICTAVNDAVGGSEEFDEGGNEWDVSGQTLSQMNFSDGYSISLNKY